jgi:hypothetical protein
VRAFFCPIGSGCYLAGYRANYRGWFFKPDRVLYSVARGMTGELRTMPKDPLQAQTACWYYTATPTDGIVIYQFPERVQTSLGIGVTSSTSFWNIIKLNIIRI